MDLSIRAHDSGETDNWRNPVSNRSTSPVWSSPISQQYSRPHDLSVPPAQWGNQEPEEEEEECELFGDSVQTGGERQAGPVEQDLFIAHQDELQTARTSQPADIQKSSITSSVRCIDGRIVRPRQREEEPPSTASACDSSIVSINTPGGVRLGAAAEPSCFW